MLVDCRVVYLTIISLLRVFTKVYLLLMVHVLSERTILLQIEIVSLSKGNTDLSLCMTSENPSIIKENLTTAVSTTLEQFLGGI